MTELSLPSLFQREGTYPTFGDNLTLPSPRLPPKADQPRAEREGKDFKSQKEITSCPSP